MPEPISSIDIAEIRITLPDRYGSYPIALSGRTRRDIHFFADPTTGVFRRRYVPGGGDESAGFFPLEQAAEDLMELQHAGNTSVVQVVSFVGATEYAAEQKRVQAARKEQDAAEAERTRLLAETRQTQEDAAALERKLSTPGVVLTAEEKAQAGRVAAAKAPKASAGKNLIKDLAALAGSAA